MLSHERRRSPSSRWRRRPDAPAKACRAATYPYPGPGRTIYRPAPLPNPSRTFRRPIKPHKWIIAPVAYASHSAQITLSKLPWAESTPLNLAAFSGAVTIGIYSSSVSILKLQNPRVDPSIAGNWKFRDHTRMTQLQTLEQCCDHCFF